MVKALFALIGLCGVIGAHNTFAQEASFPDLTTPSPYDIEINTGVGNSQGTLKWNISGGSNGPNILSELSYQDMEFSQKYASANIHIYQGMLANSQIFMSYRTGEATSGTIQDSDYNSDNRQDEYSRSHSSAVGSEMSDFELGAGYRWVLSNRQSISGLAAYINKTQNLSMTEGVQLLNTYNPNSLGPFRNTLNSRYDTDWNGMWLGGRWDWSAAQHSVGFELKHYWFQYHATANWNLRSDFAHPTSFEHWANGTGIGYSLSYQFQMNRFFALWLNWSAEDWSTFEGDDTVYFSGGDSGNTQLNEVTWEATSMAVGMNVTF